MFFYRAHKWIETTKEYFDTKLSVLKTNNNNERSDEGWNMTRINNYLSLLESIVIASVALDSTSVFEEIKPNNSRIDEMKNNNDNNTNTLTLDSDPCGCSDETNDHNNNNNNISTNNYRRKAIKKHAINAMLKNGIDIASYCPKTWEEFLIILNKQQRNKNTPNNEQFDDDDDLTKPVDKLVILCSCGDEIKRGIAQRSKSVEEWMIESPSAIGISEGNDPYYRVSLQIKDEVNKLMEGLIQ